MEEITNQLLDKIFYLQEDLAQERQENKNIKKEQERDKEYIKYLIRKNREQEIENSDKIDKITKRKDDMIGCAVFTGVGLTILIYLLIKFLLWYFF